MTNSATQTVRDHKRPRPTSRWSAVLVGLVVVTGALAVAACGSARRPATLPAGTKVTAIAAGCHHSLALTSTGRVLAWGDNANGVLGDGNTTSTDVPVEVKLPPGTRATAIAAGCFDSLAVTSTGRMLAWGDNANGQLGDGNTTSTDVPVEVKLPPGTKVTAIAGGCSQSLAVTSVGRVLAWGDNANGQLGDGNTTSTDVPVEVKLPPGTKATAIDTGCQQSLALSSTGQVLAWGDNMYGELGNGDNTSSDVPVEVKLPAGTKVTAISAGGHHGLALTSTGQVLVWGDNATGQLGDGNTTSTDVPVKVKLPADSRVTGISGGAHHSLALTSTGQVLAWGENGGQLGDGNTTQSDIPTKAKLPARAKVTAIAAGGHHSLALTSTGELLAWGYNAQGELGDGKTTSTDKPVEVSLLKG